MLAIHLLDAFLDVNVIKGKEFLHKTPEQRLVGQDIHPAGQTAGPPLQRRQP